MVNDGVIDEFSSHCTGFVQCSFSLVLAALKEAELNYIESQGSVKARSSSRSNHKKHKKRSKSSHSKRQKERSSDNELSETENGSERLKTSENMDIEGPPNPSSVKLTDKNSKPKKHRKHKSSHKHQKHADENSAEVASNDEDKQNPIDTDEIRWTDKDQEKGMEDQTNVDRLEVRNGKRAKRSKSRQKSPHKSDKTTR